MEVIRNIYEKMPDRIDVPENLRRKKAEVIILSLEDNDIKSTSTDVSVFFGSIPGFPERESQGDFEKRECI